MAEASEALVCQSCQNSGLRRKEHSEEKGKEKLRTCLQDPQREHRKQNNLPPCEQLELCLLQQFSPQEKETGNGVEMERRISAKRTFESAE